LSSDLEQLINYFKILGRFETISKVDLKISDIANLLGSDWVKLAHELNITDSDINIIKTEYPDDDGK
jgi:hypothetical protein